KGESQDDLESGEYTVMAYLNEDNQCRSEPYSVSITDSSNKPIVDVKEVKTLTNCDDEQPNGVIEAFVPSERDYLFSHSFKWYRSNLVSKKLLSENSHILEAVSAGLYLAELTHNVTGCAGEKQYQVSKFPTVPFPPRVKLERNHTRCDAPDGKALAESVDGAYYYQFDWYKEGELGSPFIEDEANPANLPAGRYLVHNVDLRTGCRSQVPTYVDVYYSVLEKEFEIGTTTSLCAQSTGTARVIPIDPFEISQATWTLLDGPTGGEQVISREIELKDAPVGEYRVDVVDANSCDGTGEFIILPDIIVYEGLSPNGDGLNDFLMIDCVDRFPNNEVEIYDRNGQIVFRVEGYDNENAIFTGLSNIGTQLGGGLLSDGTYYYHVNKGDGTTPLVGFIELLH
ncbi:MAG: gliding motility-associated C-terminal domain-containing protein, partial [Cytophagales bacterium]|nr:gliding motility-associated C-terminal domain-containing protein [Cytophagales bacterium]